MTTGRVLGLAAAVLVCTAWAAAQVPQPFPKPTAPTPSAPKPGQPAVPVKGAPPQRADAPSEDSLGVPIYPGAQFLASYDAGRGQRFYLFGVAAPYADMVTYYRNVLKTRGDELFQTPPTHQFETGRFRDETMAFPPSVTIKDYTWGGSAGYPNPDRTATPSHFATIIQIVPAPRE